MRRIVFLLTVLLTVAVAGAAWIGYDFLHHPPSKEPGEPKTVIFDPGTGIEAMSREMAAQGLVKDATLFRFYAKLKGVDQKVKPGEFALNTSMTPDEVLALLQTQGVLRKVSVPEGLTLKRIAKLVEDAGLGSAAAFEKAAADKDLLAKNNIPAPTAEGFLFPDTYLLSKRKTEDLRFVVETMLKEFNRAAGNAWQGKPPKGKSLLDAVTLASIVEKETADPAERARIAGVFVNRLAKGMLLQTDPTIIYGLGDRYDGNIRREHLDDGSNPYNTYQKKGLPPGPIASPGLASLKAVVQPEKTEYLYFVARGDGTHQFSRTLAEHNAAVAKYQLRHAPKE